MLRITIADEAQAVRIKLEGKLTGPWVKELEECWCKVSPLVGQRQFVIDVNELDFVDCAGKCLLALMHTRGGRFLAATLTMRALVEEITSHPQPDGN